MSPLVCTCGHTKRQHASSTTAWLGSCCRCACGAYYNADDLVQLEELETPDEESAA